jgi:uracil-DNA glycosylase
MKMALVGEAWGKEEAASGKPFVGNAGRILNGLLSQAGIRRDDCFITNVLNLQPKPSNDIKNCCGPRAEGIADMPALIPGKYMRAEFKPELDRLYKELDLVLPNLIVALGATASWALLRTTGIASIRGAVALSYWGKVLPTYHPQAVGYDWSLRPVLYADLCKAKREAEFPEIRRPQREVWIEPALTDLSAFEQYLDEAEMLAVDIETIGDMITCVGFAPSHDRAIVVPFYDASKPDRNYWPSFEEERTAWQWVAKWCRSPIPKVLQNGLYDINFLWKTMGIAVANATHDTMLLHHALQPELPKGLAFLGSIYSTESAWKLMRRSVTAKREE